MTDSDTIHLAGLLSLYPVQGQSDQYLYPLQGQSDQSDVLDVPCASGIACHRCLVFRPSTVALVDDLTPPSRLYLHSLY